MKKVIIVVMALSLGCNVARGQYSMEAADPNSNFSSAAAHGAAQQSIWDMTKSTPVFSQPQLTGKGWTNSPVRGNVGKVNIRNSRPRLTTTQKKQIAQNKRDAERREFFQKRQAERAQAQANARRRAEENRRRIALQNAADFNKGYTRHKQQMSGFYQKKQERDYWMMTEGAARLNSIKPMDFAQVPEADNQPHAETLDNQALADLLAPEGDVIIEGATPLKRNQSLGNNPLISMNGESSLDTDNTNAWYKAHAGKRMTDIPCVENPGTKSLKQEPLLIVSHEELGLDSLNLFILPQYGLVANRGNALLVLTDDSLRMVEWRDSEPYSYVIPCGESLVARKDRALYNLQGEQATKVLEFDTDDFSIFPYNERTIFAVVWHDNLSSIVKVDIAAKLYDEIARLPFDVWKVESNGRVTFVLAGNSIFYIDEQGNPLLFYQSETLINDMVLSTEGILIATEQAVIRLIDAKHCETFYPHGVSRMWTDENSLYMQTLSGDLMYIENRKEFITANAQ